MSATPNWVEAFTEAGAGHAHAGSVERHLRHATPDDRSMVPPLQAAAPTGLAEGADDTGIRPGLPQVDRPAFD